LRDLIRNNPKAKHMYNLLVSGNSEAWDGKKFSFNITRCVRETEGTSEDLAKRFGSLNAETIDKLQHLPCVFAYEEHCKKSPRIGWLKSIKKRTREVFLECEYITEKYWINDSYFRSIQFNLDIYGWELSRTHWAIKNVNLETELKKLNISPFAFISGRLHSVNPENHTFTVAFSFTGEARSIVEKVVHELEKLINSKDIFYDNYYKAFLARPGLDLMLSKIYKEQAKLIVVFLSGNYQQKLWPGLEFRVIKEIIFEKQHNKVMYIRVDHLPIDGVLKTDGYIDANMHTAEEIAYFIYQRIQHNE
jgi:hypothetical protein